MNNNTPPKGPDYQPVLFDTLRRVRNGYISIIKQDNRVIQINVCDRVHTAAVPAKKKDADSGGAHV
ncbi:MAG: hypothetical protein LBU16_00780 [Treponema sp.]|jgi:hypothetical protein|nr:hypothetical protein [Treponema sp.]